jgi:uncharacterized protein YndB with AHSA1/START domain
MPEESIEIAAPPEEAWAAISDITRMGEWSPETRSATWVGGASGPEVGARFKGTNKVKLPWSTTCEVTSSTPGREFAFKVGKGDTTWAYRFEPAAGGSRVTESYEIVKPPGTVLRFLTKLATGQSWEERQAGLRAGMRTTLANLKAALEG